MSNGVIDTTLLLVLGSREGHAFFLRIAVLVGEENHEVLAAEVLHEFVRQPFQSVFVGDGAFTGRDDHEHMIVVDVAGQLGQFVPVGHVGIFRPDVGVVVVDVFADEFHRLVTSVELDAAVQVAGHTTKTGEPAVESGFEFCS